MIAIMKPPHGRCHCDPHKSYDTTHITLHHSYYIITHVTDLDVRLHQFYTV